jgi:hypothetical protein
MKRADVLSAAGKAVADRGINYGQPEDNFARIARRWNAHLQNVGRSQLTATDVAIMMADVKLARLENDPTHADSWIDLAGYAACGSECAAPATLSTQDRQNIAMAALQARTEGGAPVIPANGQIIEVKQQPGESMSEAICRTVRQSHDDHAFEDRRHGFKLDDMVEAYDGQRGSVVGFDDEFVYVNTPRFPRGGWYPESLKRIPKRTVPLT